MKMREDNVNRKKSRMSKVVRWLSCAAFVSLLSTLFTFMTSCSDDLDEADVQNRPLTRAYSDEQIKLQRLGYAYDAAGNVMDDNSFTVPLINMERLEAAEKRYGPIVSAERRHYTALDIYSGATLQELGHEETKYTIDDSEAIGSGKYYRNNRTVYRGEWKSCYKAHVFIRHIMATKTIDVGMLRYLNPDDLNDEGSVLEADFRHAVEELVRKGEKGITEAVATEFSEKYGTHLVVSSNLGGMIELQMEINRDSCVDKVYATQQVTEVLMGKSVTKTTSSKVLSELPRHTIQYHGMISVKGGKKTQSDSLHKIFDHTKAAEVKISDGDYYKWATGISIEPGTGYNASFVSGRFLPLYELFENTLTRQVLRKVYETYLRKEAPTQEPDEPSYGVLPVEGNYGPDVRVAKVDTDKSCIICQEYVPSIRSDKPCVVAYPLLRGTDGKVRPFLYSGLFVGDESHRPGRVTWEGSASVYVPSDSIFAESDSTAIRELFDDNTHALKNVYFYWNAVHPQPCPTKEEAPLKYTTAIFEAQPSALAAATSFAKVASTFWSVRPVELRTDSNLDFSKYWSDDKDFKNLKDERYKEHDGLLYKDNNYTFCLLDGGENIQHASEQTDDRYANKRWTAAVSMSMDALGLKGYLPSVADSKSITKMLGNRMNIFYSHEYEGRNMLGLDWPTGFWVVSHPSQDDAANGEKNDGQGMPIVTDDVGEARIMRLSGSGTDLLLEYPNYVRAFNYSDQMYFKFFPIYITTKTF